MDPLNICCYLSICMCLARRALFTITSIKELGKLHGGQRKNDFRTKINVSFFVLDPTLEEMKHSNQYGASIWPGQPRNMR